MFDFTLFPPLETERLLLNAITIDDQQMVYNIFSDEQVTQFNDIQTFATLEDAKWFLQFLDRRFQERIGISWALRLRAEPNKLIGVAGFNLWNRRNHCGEIGYDLAQSYWGWGIMAEALRAIIDFGFQQMALNRVEAEVMVENRQSIRVLEKLAFKREGVLRQRGCWKGAFHDLYLYSLLRSDNQLKG
jgi:ribosomal-protein-alanine N-acetyltransferase